MTVKCKTLSAIALGLSLILTATASATDPGSGRDIELPDRPDNWNYQFYFAAPAQYVYEVRVYDLDGILVRTSEYQDRGDAEEAAFNIERRSVDRFAFVVDVQLPQHWILWEVFDLEHQAESMAVVFRQAGWDTRIARIMGFNPRRN